MPLEKLTAKQVEALEKVASGLSGAQFNALNPAIRRSLFRRGLIEKDWNHPHAFGDVEYLRLTGKGREVAAEVLCWEISREY